jgi:hypothetical protein
MFSRGSRFQRAGIALLLLASLSSSAITLRHVDDADAACSPIPVTHDQTAHAIGADSKTASAAADHCFLCHSLRTFYPAFDKFEHHHYAPRTERPHVAPVDRASAVVWTLAPGRAPPV